MKKEEVTPRPLSRRLKARPRIEGARCSVYRRQTQQLCDWLSLQAPMVPQSHSPVHARGVGGPSRSGPSGKDHHSPPCTAVFHPPHALGFQEAQEQLDHCHRTVFAAVVCPCVTATLSVFVP